SWKAITEAIWQTAKTNCMVIIILCGATCFTGVFLGIGGGDVIKDLLFGLGLGKWGIFWIMMLIVFILGMFIDWIGIVLITFPIFLPIARQLGFDPLWFVIMIAINLQASFLTPPFGYALFYLKGTAPEGVTIMDIYKGIIPFVFLMICGLLICVIFPSLSLWLPSLMVR
ncbi:MAG: C4-dicarboxylate ABC transporter, partial [Deltaproteobacteria bacterium]